MKPRTIREKAEAGKFFIDRLATARTEQSFQNISEGYSTEKRKKATKVCALGYGAKLFRKYGDKSLRSEFDKALEEADTSYTEGLLAKVMGYHVLGGSVKIDGGTFSSSWIPSLNDSHKLSFRKISKIIKNNLNKYFTPSVAKEICSLYAKENAEKRIKDKRGDTKGNSSRSTGK